MGFLRRRAAVQSDVSGVRLCDFFLFCLIVFTCKTAIWNGMFRADVLLEMLFGSHTPGCHLQILERCRWEQTQG